LAYILAKIDNFALVKIIAFSKKGVFLQHRFLTEINENTTEIPPEFLQNEFIKKSPSIW